ncbi:MAG: hypothetical protein ACRCUY_05380 [Thermoguttaceae bacterium]
MPSRFLIISNLVMIVSLFFVFTGCGTGHSVSGRVTFPDGKPLECGEVIFLGSKAQYSGRINKDGIYELTGATQKQGVLTGQYYVFLTGTMLFRGESMDRKENPPVYLIDPKFNEHTTSGLTCEVNGKTKYDIEVTPPEMPAKSRQR